MRNITCTLAVSAFAAAMSGGVAAQATNKCDAGMLKGRYVFTATGFTRAPTSTPGAAWAPKAILEVLVFNGDGSLTTPAVTVANPFGDSGAILSPPGAPGAYIVNDDCTGRIHFFDATGVMFNIYLEPPRGDTIWLIQTNPVNNVFQGSAKRV
jgi:hypothetical protein